MSDFQEQLIELQTRVAYQEDTLAQLNDVIARQDADAARAAMRLHLTNSRERLRHAHEEAESQR